MRAGSPVTPAEWMAARSSEVLIMGALWNCRNILPVHFGPTWHDLHGIRRHRHAPAPNPGSSLAGIRRTLRAGLYGVCRDSQRGGHAPAPADALGATNWSGVTSSAPNARGAWSGLRY